MPEPAPQFQLEPLTASEMELLQQIFRSDLPMSIKACEIAAEITRKIREAKSCEPVPAAKTNGAALAELQRTIDAIGS